MKKIISLCFMFAFAGLFFITCENKKNAKVGFLMDTFIQERWEKDRQYFIEKVQEMGGDIIVEAAQGDPDKQLELARTMIEEGVNVLVVVPVNSQSAGEIVDLAHEWGIKVIAYDRLIKNANLDYYISFDNIKVGELQAEYLSTIKPAGNYALLGGPPSDNNSFLIRLGQMNVLQPLVEKGDVKIVYDNMAEAWLEEEGKKMMEECLNRTGNNIDAVLCANDALAQGVIKVLKKNDLAGKVLVSGQDAEIEACRNIVAGTQTMSVYKPIKAIAVTAAEAAVKLAKNGDLDNANLRTNNGKKMVPSVLLPSQVVNKNTIKMTVIEDEYVEEEDVFQ